MGASRDALQRPELVEGSSVPATRSSGGDRDALCPCRMGVMLAALRAPHDIVMFATDGIISTKPLEGLERARDTDAGEKADLGDWEMGRLCGGFFLQSGVYLLFWPSGKTKSKTRGINPREMLMTMTLEEFLVGGVLREWRKPAVEGGPLPRLEIRHREYVTIGSAVTSAERYRVRGRWAVTSRFVDVHSLGVKRELLREFAPFYFSGGDRLTLTQGQITDFAALIGLDREKVREAYAAGEAFRCRMLVPTMPAYNPTPDVLSAPRMPDWIDTEYGDDLSDDLELADIVTARAT